jgi:hypothetical protein
MIIFTPNISNNKLIMLSRRKVQVILLPSMNEVENIDYYVTYTIIYNVNL